MTDDQSKPCRVGYLTSQYPATSHTFILREVEAVRDAGIDVQTFTIRSASDAELKDSAIAAEAKTTFVILAQGFGTFIAAHVRLLATRPSRYFRGLMRAFKHRPPGLRGLLLSLAHFAEAGVLSCELQRRQIDHLHNHFANSAATVGYLAAGIMDLPWSFMIHGISETDYPAGVTLPDKIRAARFVACASWFGRAQAMRVVEPEHWSKIRVIRCGLALDRLPAPSTDRSGCRLLCVGRLSPEKGQAELLDAFAAVRTKVTDARLELIGSGPQKDVLQRKVINLGIETGVNFAGRRSEADTLSTIAASDVLIVSSFMEGLPIVLMEAMALGTAVIAPRLAGIPELIDDGHNGLLYTPADVEDLEAKIILVLTDNELRSDLIERAYHTVSDEFDVKKSAVILRSMFAGLPALTSPDPSAPNRAGRRG